MKIYLLVSWIGWFMLFLSWNKNTWLNILVKTITFIMFIVSILVWLKYIGVITGNIKFM